MIAVLLTEIMATEMYYVSPELSIYGQILQKYAKLVVLRSFTNKIPIFVEFVRILRDQVIHFSGHYLCQKDSYQKDPAGDS